ncbi:hypothetical protein G6F57_021288 [Rhizopus arrhizus]|nr:hypothetical protein G6F57_021288 [Rhizopus arrhizus]
MLVPGLGGVALAVHPRLLGNVVQRARPHHGGLARLARLDALAHDHLNGVLRVQRQITQEGLGGVLLAGAQQQKRTGVVQALAHGYRAPQLPRLSRALQQREPISLPRAR